MTVELITAPGAHIVQFYEGERFLHRAIAEFFSGGLRNGDPTLMVARRPTYEAVAARLASDHDLAVVDAASRMLFVDVDSALGAFMDGLNPDPVRFEQSFSNLVSEIQRTRGNTTIWIYGEMVDVLQRAGNHAAAVRVEELWNMLFARRDIAVMCGYAIDGFDDDLRATQFRSVCRLHTHIIPAEGFTDAPDDRTRLEWVAFLQQRARALGNALAQVPPPAAEAAGITTSTVYVIDDDVSVRRSLARLLASIDLRVQTFASAEAFLAEVDRTAKGCLIVDVQLVGMSGPDLQSRMASVDWRMPVIAMSGSHDPQIEAEAMRLGATAFLRKPFDAQSLIDALRAAT
jgi:CheY-like chemotaxis protein